MRKFLELGEIVIFPNELVIYDIVKPNPPRAVNIQQEILFDVILSQGLDAPRACRTCDNSSKEMTVQDVHPFQ